jgi:maleylacetoacetate isomerase
MENISNFKNFNLYSYWRSSCSWRVRVVLNHKAIEHKITPIHLLKQEEQTEEFTKLNPIQRVPVLEFDNQDKKIVIMESIAICEFLEEAFPEKSLLPNDIIQRAKVRSICSEIASGIQPLQNRVVLLHIERLGADKIEWAKEYVTTGLVAIEKLVSESRGKYCVGDEVTMADAFLIPQLFHSRRFGVDMNLFPNLVEIEANLNELDAFKNAHPERQPDAEN